MSQTFHVQLRREHTITTYADVEVKAASPAEAIRQALELAENDEVSELNLYLGEEGTTFAQIVDDKGKRITGHNG